MLDVVLRDCIENRNDPMRSIILLYLSCMATFRMFAFESSFGLSAVDNMGDSAQPAWVAGLGWSESLSSKIYYWGRDFGPVSERQGLVTLAANLAIPELKQISAHYGLVGYAKQTSLYANEESRSLEEAPPPIKEMAYNLGGLLGLGWSPDLGRLKCNLSWDSHIFMVGGGAIIFVASARIQTFSLTFGVEL